jgi:hypothetical protein
MQLAEVLFKSGLVVGAKKPEEVFFMLATGHEVGMSPTMSLRGLFTFQGRVGMYADTMVALILNSNKCDYWTVTESDDAHCTIETRRKGAPKCARMTWTMQQAQTAGYVNKNPNWRAIPRTMLQHRCSAFLARQVYPDVCLGLYDRDELADSIRVEQTRPEVIEAEPLAPQEQAAAARVAAEAARQAPAPAPSRSPAVNDTRAEPAAPPPHDPQTGEVHPDPRDPAMVDGWEAKLRAAADTRAAGTAALEAKQAGAPPADVARVYNEVVRSLRGRQ